jgi:formiminoglutamase
MEDKFTTSARSLLSKPEGQTTAVSLLGIPSHLAAITPGRCDLAPEAIREALSKYSTFDSIVDRDVALACADHGDLDVADLRPEEAFPIIRDRVAAIAAQTSTALILLGGDNSITRPALLGFTQCHPRCGVITLDAHHDVRDLELGLTNGNPISALLADGFPGSQIVQLGIQPFANSGYYTQFVRDHGIHFLTISEYRNRGGAQAMQWAFDLLAPHCDAIYIDLDIDVLDRIYAPSAGGSRPGGMTIDELLPAVEVASAYAGPIAMDLVEHNPANDVNGTTSYSAALLLLHFLSGISQRQI